MDYQEMLERAMEMEALSRDYYEWLAARSVNTHAAGTLRQLAAEEREHLRLLQELSTSPLEAWARPGERLAAWEVGEESVDLVWRRYTAALDDVRESILTHTDELTTLEKAKELELQSEQLYREPASRTKEAAVRRLFEWLARAEHRHYDYVSKLLSVSLAMHEEFPEARPDL